MGIKKVIGTVLVMAVLAAIGLGVKQTYKDFNEETDPLNKFQVGVISENLLDVQLEQLELLLDEQNIIAAVTCRDTFEYHFRCVTQSAEVEHIFKGDQLEVGETISIARTSPELFFELGISDYAINMGFVNEMVPGKTYLVFLDYELDEPRSPQRIFLQSKDLAIAPIFCYDEIANYPCEVIEGGADSALYENVKENEFFIKTQAGIEKMEQFKEKVLEIYSY